MKKDVATPSKPKEEILCKAIYFYLNKRKLLSASTDLFLLDVRSHCC